jgi:hypothetical protein
MTVSLTTANPPPLARSLEFDDVGGSVARRLNGEICGRVTPCARRRVYLYKIGHTFFFA